MSSATVTSRYSVAGRPSQLPEPKSVNSCGMPWMMELPPVYQLTTPVTTEAVPRVVMRALTPKRVTSRPEPVWIAGSRGGGPPFGPVAPAGSIAAGPTDRLASSVESVDRGSVLIRHLLLRVVGWQLFRLARGQPEVLAGKVREFGEAVRV